MTNIRVNILVENLNVQLKENYLIFLGVFVSQKRILRNRKKKKHAQIYIHMNEQ